MGKQNLCCLKSLMLVITPFVTSLSVGISPTLAATFVVSSSGVDLNEFSVAPQDVGTFTDARTLALAPDGQVEAIASADAAIDNSFAGNTSFSTARGSGNQYFGLAQSVASVAGAKFLINQNETFSFNINAFLGLLAFNDNPGPETATATGEISLKLIDEVTQVELDSLTISGKLVNSGNDDFIDVKVSNPNNFTLTSDITKSFGATTEIASAFVGGRYSRFFSSPTSLRLVEVKTNQALVRTPESSSALGVVFIGLLGVGLGIKSKRSQKPQLALSEHKP